MTNLVSLLKSRDITLPTKVHLVKAMVFAVVMYDCESWTIKKAGHQRIDTFEMVVLEKTLENPLDSKEIQPDHPKGNQSQGCCYAVVVLQKLMIVLRVEIQLKTPRVTLYKSKADFTHV